MILKHKNNLNMNLIPWAKPNLTKNDINKVKKTLDTGWISGGPDVERFENNLKSYLRSKYVCVTNNGTSALNLSFLALASFMAFFSPLNA